MAGADLDDLGGEAVEEVAVVGDDDERAGVAEQGFQEDLLRGQVEVVRGLVEEEAVGGLEEELGEGKAAPLAAGEDAHALVDGVAREEEGAEEAADVRGGFDRGGAHHLLEDRVCLVEHLGVVLREIAEAHVVAETARAAVER